MAGSKWLTWEPPQLLDGDTRTDKLTEPTKPNQGDTSVSFGSPSPGGNPIIRSRRTLPSCPRCGGYALYRLPNDTSDCETCGANFPTVRLNWKM
jgi:hypothetical protein